MRIVRGKQQVLRGVIVLGAAMMVLNSVPDGALARQQQPELRYGFTDFECPVAVVECHHEATSADGRLTASMRLAHGATLDDGPQLEGAAYAGFDIVSPNEGRARSRTLTVTYTISATAATDDPHRFAGVKHHDRPDPACTAPGCGCSGCGDEGWIIGAGPPVSVEGQQRQFQMSVSWGAGEVIRVVFQAYANLWYWCNVPGEYTAFVLYMATCQSPPPGEASASFDVSIDSVTVQ